MNIQTTSRIQLIDITASLNKEIAETGIGTGMAMAYSPHTTTAIIINENEHGLTEDILKLLHLIVPQERYAHDRIDNNARSHLQAVVLGNSVCVPIENGGWLSARGRASFSWNWMVQGIASLRCGSSVRSK